MTKQKQPQYRFDGFDGEWEEKILGDVVSINSGKDYKHLNSGNIPVYGTGGYMLSVDKSLAEQNGIGIGRKGTIDKPYILEAPFWTVDTLFYCLPEKSQNLQFIFSIFQRINWKKLDESTGVPSLSKQAIKKVNISTPSLPEQEAIGELFQTVDQLIQLQDQKLATLKEQKQTFLRKMFPAQGQKVPEIRLQGFYGEWEEKKLGEVLIYEQPTKYIVKNSEYNNTYSIPVLTAGKSFILGFTNETQGIKEASINNPIIIFDDFTTSSHLVTFPFKVKSSAMKLLTTCNDNYNLYFVNNLLNTIDYTPTNHERHWISKFSKFNIFLPSLSEQEAIGDFFQTLDQQMSQTEEKLMELKALKQTLLNRLFV